MAARKNPRTLRRDAAMLLAHCPGFASRLAARRISQFLDRELQEADLSAAQLGLLAEVASAADDKMGAIAARTGVDPSTLSRTLRTLEAMGLVEIALVEADLRQRAVWLTEKGARQLEAAIPLWRKAQARLARRLAPEAMAALAKAAVALDES
jgi:DNA-binding MarR family transcriptional regulator